MKWIDALFAWALVLLGGAHFLAAWVPKLAVLRGPWTGGAAVAIVSMGLMNAVRSQRRKDGFLSWMTALVTALTGAMCIGVLYHFPGNVLHQPAALATGVLAVVELFFALAR
ncbi:MAG TPA: hypothetical protein VM578_07845 [Candidatus Saccharimonadales bacterium]|nr:hypothetical protein [Candidatus Saccharimonadales bacterium]